jgi:hypothetical protein
VRALLALAALLILIAIVWFAWPESPPELPVHTAIQDHTVEPVDSEPPPASLATASPAESPAVSLSAPLAWPQATRRDLGCMLERETGYKDGVWNCDSDEQPLGDPCADLEGFYRGPQLPAEYAAKISPLLESVNFHWERRRLQEVDFIFKKGVEEQQILDAFSLPRTLKTGLGNVTSVDLQDCVPGSKCLVVQGFDPGDVNCGDGRQPD